MRKIALLGFGKIAESLLKAILTVADKKNIYVYSENGVRWKAFSEKENGFPRVESYQEAVEAADFIFCCVKTEGVIPLLKRCHFKKHQVVFYLSPSLVIDKIEQEVSIPVVQCIPSITVECQKGTTLFCYGKFLEKEKQDEIHCFFSTFSNVVVVSEKNIFPATILTSCMPAFIAKIIEDFAIFTSNEFEISKESAESMLCGAMQGTSELILKGVYTPHEVVEQVATQGGVTEKGIAVMSPLNFQLIEKLISATMGRRPDE